MSYESICALLKETIEVLDTVVNGTPVDGIPFYEDNSLRSIIIDINCPHQRRMAHEHFVKLRELLDKIRSEA